MAVHFFKKTLHLGDQTVCRTLEEKNSDAIHYFNLQSLGTQPKTRLPGSRLIALVITVTAATENTFSDHRRKEIKAGAGVKSNFLVD